MGPAAQRPVLRSGLQAAVDDDAVLLDAAHQVLSIFRKRALLGREDAFSHDLSCGCALDLSGVQNLQRDATCRRALVSFRCHVQIIPCASSYS